MGGSWSESESEYSSVDEHVGLGGRRSLISSLMFEDLSNAISSFSGGDLSGESSGIIELSRGES